MIATPKGRKIGEVVEKVYVVRKPKQGNKMFRKKPMCEICKKKEATHFSLERPDTTNHELIKEKGNWKFVCADEEDYNEMYSCLIKEFFKTPIDTVDWMAHLHEKGWMNWNNFMDMIDRFRKDTEGYDGSY